MPKSGSMSRIRTIFENMETTNVLEGVVEEADEAELWLQNTDLIILPKTKNEIYQTIEKCLKGIKVFYALDSKMLLLNKLANEVKKRSTLLCQLELNERHILVKDSKNKAVPMFIDYLKYYAQWSCMIYDECPDYEPYGLCHVILDYDTALPIIGAIIGAALAAKNGLLVQIHPIMRPLAQFLLEIFECAGFPPNTIAFIEYITFTEMDYQIQKLTVVGNFPNWKFDMPYEWSSHKHALSYMGKNSAIIFENADQDSACDKLLDCAWSCQRMFPFGINELFVQESIFEEFVQKIKSKILKLNVGFTENRKQNQTTDILISGNADYSKEKIEKVNNIPLQIGYKTFGKSLSEEATSEILSILAFRTTAEAISLVNNNKFGLGVSIWSDNISLCNELTGKIKAGILWFNAHGIISPNAAFCPVKHSGSGYFGGKEGLLEYMKPKEEHKLYNYPRSLQTNFNEQDVHKCVESVTKATKAYETWCKYSPTVRSQHLLEFSELSSSLRTTCPTFDFDEFWIKPLQYWSVFANNTKSIIQLQGNIELKTIKEPVGVIIIDIMIVRDFEIIIAALAYGNAVIVINCCSELDCFFEGLIKIMPKTMFPDKLLKVICSDDHVFEQCRLHPESSYKFHALPCIYTDINIGDYGKVISREDILNAVTYNKCIWTTFGETL